MFHMVPERAHDLSRWRLFVAQEVKVSGVLDEIIIYKHSKDMYHIIYSMCICIYFWNIETMARHCQNDSSELGRTLAMVD